MGNSLRYFKGEDQDHGGQWRTQHGGRVDLRAPNPLVVHGGHREGGGRKGGRERRRGGPRGARRGRRGDEPSLSPLPASAPCIVGDDKFHPTSRPHYKPQNHSDAQPGASRRPHRTCHQQDLGPHGLRAATAGVAALARGPNIVHLQRSSKVLANRVVAPRTEDIDESSAHSLYRGQTYAKANAMLIPVAVSGTTKTFWRLSDKATRISRKLALILRDHHSVGKCITAPLQVSNVLISSSGSVKLRGVSFTDEGFSITHVRDDYKHLSRVLQALIRISGGDITKLPPDYTEFLSLLESDTLAMKDEFLIANNTALLPMKNRTEVFLMLYDRIKYLGRMGAGQEKEEKKQKQKRILSELPYKNDWLNTARANAKINQWVVDVKNPYKMTQFDLLCLNRNVRSHLHQYGDDNVEEILYCEWPELLMAMEKMLHVECELEGCDIQNKFG